MSDSTSNDGLPEKPLTQMTAKNEAKLAGATHEHIDRIYLLPFPKVVFLYPTFLAALIAAIWLAFSGSYSEGGPSDASVYLTVAFLVIFALNLIVISFDFPRATSLTVFFVVAAVVLGLVLLFVSNPTILPSLSETLKKFRPGANATFFWTVCAFFVVIYTIVRFAVKFDYWEVRQNELLHHHGVLSDLKRYSAPNIRIDKEINDVFEYMLLGAGRLIIQPSGERKAIVLDNVLFISRKEKSITRMLGALQVDVRKHDH